MSGQSAVHCEVRSIEWPEVKKKKKLGSDVTQEAGPPGWVLVPGSELILVLWSNVGWEKEERVGEVLILLLHDVLLGAPLALQVQTLHGCHISAAIKYIV